MFFYAKYCKEEMNFDQKNLEFGKANHLLAFQLSRKLSEKCHTKSKYSIITLPMLIRSQKALQYVLLISLSRCQLQ